MYWLECDRSAVPGAGQWLGARERQVLEGLDFPKRREDWLLGRWAAKNALIRLMPASALTPADCEILAAADGAPEIWLSGKPAAMRISLSHSHGHCLCALGATDRRLGCDLELIEARSTAFEETYFSDAELELLQGCTTGDRDRLVTLIWSAKESLLKALRTGLRSDTRRIRIESIRSAGARAWSHFHAVDGKSGDSFRGWWRCCGEMLMTIACDGGPAEPVELRPSAVRFPR